MSHISTDLHQYTNNYDTTNYDPNDYLYLARKKPRVEKVVRNMFTKSIMEEEEKTKISDALVWRGAEWYQIVRLTTLNILSTFYGGIRHHNISRMEQSLDDYGLPNFAAKMEACIRELQIIETVQIKKLVKFIPELVGLINADWLAVITDLAKIVRHARAQTKIIYRNMCYVMWTGSDMVTTRVIMACTHLAITGFYSPKYFENMSFIMFYRDQEDRFGKNHQHNDNKVSKYVDVRLCQLPREPRGKVLSDYRTFTCTGKPNIQQWFLPDGMKWPAEWVFALYDKKNIFENFRKGPPEVPQDYSLQY